MTRTQGTVVIALLVAVLAVVVYRACFASAARPRFEYWAGEGEKVDLQSLQHQGQDGWDCSLSSKGEPHSYIMLCKRPL